MIAAIASASATFRYITAMVGCVLFATNFGFIAMAPSLFPKQTCRFWRLFFLGKSFITAASIVLLWTLEKHNIHIHWYGSPLFLTGYLLSLSALVFAYIKRPFAGIPLEHVAPTEDDVVLAQGKEVS